MNFSRDHKTLFVTATKDSPARTMVYAIDIESGEMKKISNQEGTYSSAGVSDDGKKLLANFVSFGKLTELVRQQENKKPKILTDPHPEEAKALTAWVPEFFDYENRHGHTIHGMMFKPGGWSEKSKSVTDGSYRSNGYFF